MNGATFPDLEGSVERLSVEAEARLLALGFSRLSALDSVLGKVQARDFAGELHRRVWPILTAARAAGESEIDPIAIADRLGCGPERLPELLGELNLISQQTDYSPATTARAESLADVVLKHARDREQRAALHDVAALAFANDRPAAQRLQEARKVLEQAQERAVGRFALVPVSGLHEQEPPRFVWDGLIPANHVTLLAAHGGTGKSLIALMLAVSVAMGLPLFDTPTQQGRVVFFSGEDDGALLRHRLGFICSHMGIDPAELEGKLFLVDATGHDPVLYRQPARGEAGTTPTYDALRAYVREVTPALVILDNASDVFGGNEIDRAAVRAFMRHAALLGRDVGAATLLLAHVDKGTSRGDRGANTEGYSGSTAWSNSARSRLFMSRDKDGAIELQHQKSNLGKLRDPIRLHWPDGGLPQVNQEEGAPDYSAMAERAEGGQQDKNAVEILKMLAEYEGRQQFASTAASAKTNVFALLRADPEFKRLNLGRDAVAAIVTQSQRAGWIERLLYRTPQRKDAERWTVTNKGKQWAGLPFAPSAPSAPSCHVSADSAQGASPKGEGAPSAPSS